MSNIRLHNMDCMKAMAEMQDNAFDLAIVDPPYNIGKASWDKWRKASEYYNYILTVLKELERLLKDNASIYLFHNDFNQLAEIQHLIAKDTSYILRQFIVWNKRFNGSPFKGYMDGYVSVSGLRNYQKLAEYICFYTFQDETGLSKIMGNCVYPVRNYIRAEILRAKGKINFKQINSILGTATNGGGVASAVLSLEKTCPAMITEEHYHILRKWLNDDSTEYEYLRTEYEYLRTEYENLRYFFNSQGTFHSVWDIDIPTKETTHETEKPVFLYENILKHSARPGCKVIDPFLGSGSIAIACHNLDFDLTGYEIDKDYYDAAVNRLEQHKRQLRLFDGG